MDLIPIKPCEYYAKEKWTQKREVLPNGIITFVYWNVSCLPEKIASIDSGAVSIWHMPDAEHSAEHECPSLLEIFNHVHD